VHQGKQQRLKEDQGDQPAHYPAKDESNHCLSNKSNVRRTGSVQPEQDTPDRAAGRETFVPL
jgi:hypothetical protein